MWHMTSSNATSFQLPAAVPTLTNMRPKTITKTKIENLLAQQRVLWVYLCHSCATTGIADKLWLRLIAPPQQQPEATLISRTLASSILNLNLCAWTGPGHSKLFDNAYSKRKKHKKKPNLSELKPQINIVLCALLKFEFQMSHATGKIYFSFFFFQSCGGNFYIRSFLGYGMHISGNRLTFAV